MLMRAEINFNQKGNSIGGIFIFFGKIIFNSKINILISLTVCPNTQENILQPSHNLSPHLQQKHKRAKTLSSSNDITLLKNPSQNQKIQQAGSTRTQAAGVLTLGKGLLGRWNNLSECWLFSPIRVVDCNTIFLLYIQVFFQMYRSEQKKALYCVTANEPVADIFNRYNMIGKRVWYMLQHVSYL